MSKKRNRSHKKSNLAPPPEIPGVDHRSFLHITYRCIDSGLFKFSRNNITSWQLFAIYDELQNGKLDPEKMIADDERVFLNIDFKNDESLAFDYQWSKLSRAQIIAQAHHWRVVAELELAAWQQRKNIHDKQQKGGKQKGVIATLEGDKVIH